MSDDAAVLVRDDAPELRLVRAWLNNWSGLGLVVARMTHQGWDVQLTSYAARDWRANFFPVGIEHSIVGGSAWERRRGGRCSGRRGRLGMFLARSANVLGRHSDDSSPF